MKKYTLSDDKIMKIARVAVRENGEDVVGKEVSLMANLFELQTKYTDIYDYVRNGGWFGKAGPYMDSGTASAAAIAATKDVLINGNRQFPAYINEHDCFSDITSVTNNGVSFTVTDRSKYIKDVTIIKNVYGSTYTFYEFPSKYSDPFGYTDYAYKKLGGQKEVGLICTSEEEYINKIAEAAQKACKRYGYLPSVLIGQSCLENGYGIRSYWDNPQIELLLKYNNMVGIKTELLNNSWVPDYTVWEGESLNKNTPEEYNGKMVTIKDNFRKYDTPERSFCDFLLFLTYASNSGKGGSPKYGQEVLSIKDPAKLIQTVANRGYATGSTYPTSVMRIVNKHNLTKYDDLSKVTASNYIPAKLKQKEEDKIVSNIKKLGNRTINDITAANKGQIPASRGSNPIKFIVVHYLGVPNADNPYLYGGGYGGHYNIKRDGSIYLAANPRTAVVWQCGGGLQGSGGHSFHKICTNYNSIGIECGVAADTTARDLSGDSNLWYFTEETQESLVFLVSKLMDEYGISMDHVIRHYDVTGKICPNPYVKNNGRKTSWTWDQFKANLVQYRKDGTITIPNGLNSSTPSTTTNTFSVLRKGSTGSAVKTMQKMLIAIGYSCGSAGADGDFGNQTLTALKKFQTDYKLTVDGVYGSQSKTALEKAYKEKTTTPAQTNTNTSSNSYMVKITADVLNIRSGPGTNYNVVGQISDHGIYTIVQKSGKWGKLKSGIGWISLNYTKKV